MPAGLGSLGGSRAKSMDDERVASDKSMQTPGEKIQLMLDDVKTIIGRKGNYSIILVGIQGIEKISKQEGLKVPEEIPELRKKAYALQSKKMVESARNFVEVLGCPYSAKDVLKSAEAYAKKASSSIPKEIYELRELIAERWPSQRANE
jgi:hypothetical protein